jgi:hypothetical protein
MNIPFCKKFAGKFKCANKCAKPKCASARSRTGALKTLIINKLALSARTARKLFAHLNFLINQSLRSARKRYYSVVVLAALEGPPAGPEVAKPARKI